MQLTITVRPACDLCGKDHGQTRIVELDDCPQGCDGIHRVCNPCNPRLPGITRYIRLGVSPGNGV